MYDPNEKEVIHLEDIEKSQPNKENMDTDRFLSALEKEGF